MAVIVLTSAAGSPGVTTTAVGFAVSAPRPVLLVEADPTGGSGVLAGYFRGAVEHTGGLLDLAWAHREGRLAAQLPAASVPFPGSSSALLPGVRSHRQAAGLAGVWEPLAAALRDLEATGQDVLVDAGRAGLADGPDPVLVAADLVVLVVRSDLVAVAAARSWADTLADRFPGRAGLLLIGPGRPYSAREIASVLPLPLLTSLVWDPAAAAVFSHGTPPPRRFTSSAYLASVRTGWALVRANAAASANAGTDRDAAAPAGANIDRGLDLNDRVRA